MPRLTSDELREIRERAVAATRGPWFAFYGGEPCLIGNGSSGAFVCEVKTPNYRDGHNLDADFIARAEQDIPALLDTIAELEAELERERNRPSVNEMVRKFSEMESTKEAASA